MPARAPSSLAARALVLLAAAAAAAAVANLLHPAAIPWVHDWSRHVEAKALEAGLRVAPVDQARSIVDAGTHLVFDARPLSDYDLGHLPGAMPFPDAERQEYLDQYEGLLGPDVPLLIYCSGQSCDESLRLCLYLREQGSTNLVLFTGGMEAWRGADAPVEGGS